MGARVNICCTDTVLAAVAGRCWRCASCAAVAIGLVWRAPLISTMPRPAQPLMHTLQTAQREPGPQCRPGTAGAAALTWTPRKRLGARCTVCTAGCVPNAVNSAPYLQLHAAASSGAPSSRSHCVGAGEHASPALWRPSRVETKESRRLLRANSILAVGTLPTPTNAARPPAADKIGGHKEARLSYQLLHRHIIFMIGPPSGQHQEGVARTGRRETRGHTVACGRSNCEQAPLRQLRGVVRGPMQTAMISAASRQHLRCVPGQAKLLLRGPAGAGGQASQAHVGGVPGGGRGRAGVC